MEDLTKRLLGKSIEAFMMAIEVYNKPSIQYRVEGFALFICNSWELMLKSFMLKTYGHDSIYFKDKPDRTLSLENCITKVFTNDKDPLRINLEKIIELRNTSTHFITEEYEMVYVPLFQSCVLNFNDKMMKFHEIDMTTKIPQNFLTLSVSMKSLEESEVIARYPEEIAKKIIDLKTTIDDLTIQNNANFAIRINHYHFVTKDKDMATSFIKLDQKAVTGVKIIKELKDPNKTHKYTTKKSINLIRDRLHSDNIVVKYRKDVAKFTSFHFNNFCKYYGLKENEKFCYIHKQYTAPQYTYSLQIVEFIIEEIKKDPEYILDKIKIG